MKAILTVLLAGAAGLGLTGCLVHHHRGHGHAYHHPGHVGVEVAIPSSHYHDHYCGHYHYGDRWYYRSHHRHGPGCGHVFIGGRWTLRL